MRKIIFVRGMQASGKSTWAKEFVKENQDYKRVSRDDFRHMISSYTFNGKNEKLVTVLEKSAIHEILANGYSLIIDKMNLNSKELTNDWEFIKHVCALNNIQDYDIDVKDFPVTLAEAIKRDKNREFVIGEKVLRATWSKYEEQLEKMLNIPKPQYDSSIHDCIICDVDGTLADRGSRNAFDFKRVGEDTVKEPIRDLVMMLKNYKTVESSRPTVIIFSGRDDSCAAETVMWLKNNNVQFDQIFMRKTGDKRKDSIVKKELYENHVKGKFNVLYWIDDRRQVIDMVRNELGLTCLDVAGNSF